MSEDRPNIVLVTVDSLRADHCGFMGYEKDTTPNLDRMAEDGVVFENAISPAPFTEQSMPAIFTGYDVPPGDDDNFREHTQKREMLPERLKRRGYRTAGFSPNPFASRSFGFEQGFDEFSDFFGNNSKSEIGRTMLSRIAGGDFIEAIRLSANMAGYNIPGIGNQSIPLRSYYDRAIEWIESGEEPFFLWLFLLEVHSPYRPTREYRSMWLPQMLYLNLVRSHLFDRDPTPEEIQQLRELYDGTIQVVDAAVERLMSDLESYDPILVFHSDHGEAFGEHDNLGHDDYLYEENIHVPFFIANGPESERIDAPVSLLKLSDIVTRLADERSLTSEVFDDELQTAQVNQQKVAVRGRSQKYILDESGGRGYDLKIDPKELDPMEQPEPELVGSAASHVLSVEERIKITDAARGFEE